MPYEVSSACVLRRVLKIKVENRHFFAMDIGELLNFKVSCFYSNSRIVCMILCCVVFFLCLPCVHVIYIAWLY